MCLACKEYVQDLLTSSEWLRNTVEVACAGDKAAQEKWRKEECKAWAEHVAEYGTWLSR